MGKSDLMDTYTFKDSSCGSKPNWALVRRLTCKAAAERSNVYVSGKKNIKILLILMALQGKSTSTESKEERVKKKSINR